MSKAQTTANHLSDFDDEDLAIITSEALALTTRRGSTAWRCLFEAIASDVAEADIEEMKSWLLGWSEPGPKPGDDQGPGDDDELLPEVDEIEG